MTGAAAVAAAAGAGREQIRIRPATTEFAAAVRAFNTRLAAQGVPYQFPEPPPSGAAPTHASGESHDARYVAVDRDGMVRGGYTIKLRNYCVRGETRSLGFYRLPLSEGLVDSRYGLIGARLLADALKRQPDLFVLGIGGFQESLARMLGSLGWSLQEVPLYFRIVHPSRFSRGIRHLRGTALRRLALDAAAVTGIAWAGALLLQRKARQHDPATTSDIVQRFGDWADAIWEAAQSQHLLVGSRDAATLNALYPAADRRFIRVRVCRNGGALGWALLLNTQMSDDKYFGSLRVGTIVDCLARSPHTRAVVAEAVAVLRERGVDLIVSNQSAECWGDALRAEGFVKWRSGFLFGASRNLAARLALGNTGLLQVHLNRGDGDGPIHL